MSTTEQKAARWYAVDIDGAATLCVDQADAEQVAKTAQAAWPHLGPHRAVQLVEAPLMGAAGDAGWVSVEERLPPCRDDQDYIGINSAGFAGIFNAFSDIAGTVYCMMETAEESVSIMSDLSIWKPFTRPLPTSSAKGVAHG